MSKIDYNKTAGFYVTQSAIWRLVCELDPEYMEKYQLALLQPAKKLDIMNLINMAWIRFASMMRRHEEGTQPYWELPYPICYSRSCMEVLVDDKDLIQQVMDGSINYFMLVRISKARGVLQ